MFTFDFKTTRLNALFFIEAILLLIKIVCHFCSINMIVIYYQQCSSVIKDLQTKCTVFVVVLNL